MPKTKTAEPKISFVETGRIELNIRIPHLYSGAIIHIIRDMRRTLENCADLNLLDEFIETRIVEYAEVLPNEWKSDIKCKVCGGDLIMGACATECIKCRASVNPETGEPYMDNDKIVKVCSFGGRTVP